MKDSLTPPRRDREDPRRATPAGTIRECRHSYTRCPRKRDSPRVDRCGAATCYSAALCCRLRCYHRSRPLPLRSLPAISTHRSTGRRCGASRELAGKPYQAQDVKLPDPFSKLTYDQYRTIRFDTSRTLWRGAGLPFEIQFFHPGFLYTNRIDLYEVTGGQAQPIRYSPDLFNFGELPRPTGEGLGFAGFRIHHPLNRPDYSDEICAFLGASYFRAVGRHQGYGLSAAAWPSRPRTPGERSSQPSKPSGLSGRCRAAAQLSFMRYSTARARRRRSGSTSDPATRRSSTSSARSTRARILQRPGSLL